MKLMAWLKQFLQPNTYEQTVDAYVSSKRPTSAVEVEIWIKEFERKNRGSL
jgi:hypothetical protein